MNIEKFIARQTLILYLENKYNIMQVAHILGKSQGNIQKILEHLKEEKEKMSVIDSYASYIISI